MEVTRHGRRARLLRVDLRPTFVIDDGESLTEFPGPPMVVTQSAWKQFAQRSFNEQDLEIVLAEYEKANPPARAPNRAQRRAKPKPKPKPKPR